MVSKPSEHAVSFVRGIAVSVALIPEKKQGDINCKDILDVWKFLSTMFKSWVYSVAVVIKMFWFLDGPAMILGASDLGRWDRDLIGVERINKWQSIAV